MWRLRQRRALETENTVTHYALAGRPEEGIPATFPALFMRKPLSDNFKEWFLGMNSSKEKISRQQEILNDITKLLDLKRERTWEVDEDKEEQEGKDKE